LQATKGENYVRRIYRISRCNRTAQGAHIEGIQTEAREGRQEMNTLEIIEKLEKQLRLRPSAEAITKSVPGNPKLLEAIPTDACPRCHGEMVFTLQSGRRWCLSCGEL
jgi:hypothetical protein